MRHRNLLYALATTVCLVLIATPARAAIFEKDTVDGYDCAESMDTSGCFTYDGTTTGTYGTKDVKTCTKSSCWFCWNDYRMNRTLCASTKSEARCYCKDDGWDCTLDGRTSGWCKVG